MAAESLAAQGEPAQGIEGAEAAVKRAPFYGRSLECLGNPYLAHGEFARALADLTRA